MKNKTAFALTAAMILSFCTNSQAGALADLIYARIDAMIASGETPTSFSSSDMDAFRKSYNASSSSSLVSKSQVSSSSSSSSSLSNLLDQRLAAATLQAQAARAKATAVNFSSGEYIPTRNVDGYSVTASGVKATPTVKPSASAATPALVNKVKIQSASPQQQTQIALAQQQAKLAAAQQKATVAQQSAAATAASRAQKTASYYGMSAADVAQFNQQVAKAKANADAGIYYNQAKAQAKAYQSAAKVASSGNFLQDTWALVGNSNMAKYVAKAQQAHEQKFTADLATIANKYSAFQAKSDAQQAARLQRYSSMSSAQLAKAINNAKAQPARGGINW